MMLDRFTQHTVDPLTLMSNVSHQQHYSQSSITLPSTYVPPHFADNTKLDSGLSSTYNLIENLTNTLALLTQSYKMYLPQTNNQLRTSSNPRNQATVQDGRVVVQNVQGRQNRGQGNNARGVGVAGHIARNCTHPKHPQNSEYFKDKMLLMQAQEIEVALDEEQLLFIAGGQENAIDEDVDKQPVQDLALNVDNVFQADDCDAFDSNVDEAPTAQTIWLSPLAGCISFRLDLISDTDAPPPPQSQTPVVAQAPHTMSTIKLPILKKGEYDLWAMKMEHYLAHTDYPLWEVIQKGNGPVNEMAGGYDFHENEEVLQKDRSKGNQDSRRRDAWNTRNKDKDNGRRSGKQEEFKALVTLDGEGVDWTSHSEDEQENYALMAYSSSGSDSEVTSCLKECKESYAKLKKLYDEQREQLGDASIEIHAYTQALKKVEAQLVSHQQSQLWYEEKIRFMKIDLDDKTDVLTYHKKLLVEAEKEKEELKAKVEKWHNSSKNLNILLNSQMTAKDKVRLGYGDQMNKGVLSYENEVFQSVFVSRTSDIENSPANDRYAEGMHEVPPLMTGIYIPSGPDKEIDDSQFTYGPKQSKPSEFDARNSDFNSCESNSSEETHETMPEPVVNEPKVVSQPKVWSDAPIIEEYESDSDDEHVSVPSKEQETPSFAFINTVKHVKTPRQTVKEQNTCSKSPKPDKKDCSGLMSKKLGLGYRFTKKACFVCGKFSHLIRDCDFHEKRMAKQAKLNNRMCKGLVKWKIGQYGTMCKE
ncbi:ribonuclease H-like domain-containing protein [Tanacetum coccineum]